MGDVQEVQLHVREATSDSSISKKDANAPDQFPESPSEFRSWIWWIKVALYIFFILTGQTVATLLGRLYYNQGGNSKWIQTIVTSAGFPLLLPLMFSSSTPLTNLRMIIPICIGIGLLLTGDNLMYAYGLLYLPVSTYALICATQLGFNAVFSYFLNAQKFTALIFNSVVLVTFSAALLGVNSDDSTSNVSKAKYPLGFILTLGASAAFSLILSLSQLTYQKVLKKPTFSSVMRMLMYSGFVSTVAAVGGLFASGEWSSIRTEMKEFGKGETSYVIILVWTAICWQATYIGTMGLTFTVSSLFSNLICTFGLPLVPVFAVVFFHDKMNGVKIMAMLIAIWGFMSYVYQDFLDYLRTKNATKHSGSLGPTA